MGTPDQRYEVEHLKYCLMQNQTNNMALLIPSSIVVYNSQKPDQMLCEFDGLVIYPTKKEEQILFLESKNTNERGKAKKCLCRKFKRLNLSCDMNQIQSHKQNVYTYQTI